jgi:hypothetical protein
MVYMDESRKHMSKLTAKAKEELERLLEQCEQVSAQLHKRAIKYFLYNSCVTRNLYLPMIFNNFLTHHGQKSSIVFAAVMPGTYPIDGWKIAKGEKCPC